MTSEKNIIETDGDDDYWMMVHLNLAIMLASTPLDEVESLFVESM